MNGSVERLGVSCGMVALASMTGCISAGQVPQWALAGHDGEWEPITHALDRGTLSVRGGVSGLVPVDLDSGPGECPQARARLESMPGAEETAQFHLTVDAPEGAISVLALDPVDGWAPIKIDRTWPAREGVTLALTARRFADAEWDGAIRMIARFHNGEKSDTSESPDAEAVLTLRAAPFVMSSSPQPAQKIFVRAYPSRNDGMVKDLERIAAHTGVALHVVPGDAPYPAHHIWMQDAVEFGHAWTGRPDAPAFALSSNRDRDLDGFAQTRLKEAGVEVLTVGSYRPEFAAGDGGDSWIDWYGNLEASPPTPDYPFGRIIYGVNPDTGAQLNPEVVAFLAAQGVQDPVPFDVGWLQIKHVDELVSFMPADDADWPYRLVVPDPQRAIELLRELVERGHGHAAMLKTYEEGTTVASLLAEQEMIDFNLELLEKRLEPAYATLCEQLGLEAQHVVRLPVLFRSDGSARTPNVVNALMVNGHVAMSDPDGPDLPHGDPFQNKVLEILKEMPVEVHFVDDQLYHRWSGNVHCATNALRRPLEVDFAESPNPGRISTEAPK